MRICRKGISFADSKLLSTNTCLSGGGQSSLTLLRRKLLAYTSTLRVMSLLMKFVSTHGRDCERPSLTSIAAIDTKTNQGKFDSSSCRTLASQIVGALSSTQMAANGYQMKTSGLQVSCNSWKLFSDSRHRHDVIFCSSALTWPIASATVTVLQFAHLCLWPFEQQQSLRQRRAPWNAIRACNQGHWNAQHMWSCSTIGPAQFSLSQVLLVCQQHAIQSHDSSQACIAIIIHRYVFAWKQTFVPSGVQSQLCGIELMELLYSKAIL